MFGRANDKLRIDKGPQVLIRKPYCEAQIIYGAASSLASRPTSDLIRAGTLSLATNTVVDATLSLYIFISVRDLELIKGTDIAGLSGVNATPEFLVLII